jgi:hypothetical protein
MNFSKTHKNKMSLKSAVVELLHEARRTDTFLQLFVANAPKFFPPEATEAGA